jgi:hypothetical protein
MIKYHEHKLNEAPSYDMKRAESLADVNAEINMGIISRIRDSREF